MKVLTLRLPKPTITIPTLSHGKLIFSISWPYIAIIAAHLIWGANFVVAKLALHEIPPMSLAFLRFFLAILLLLPFVLLEKNVVKIDKKDLPSLFGIGVLMVTLNIAFFYLGLQRTTATTASILTMIIPIISILAGWVLLREKVYVVNLIGIILGLAGTVLVIGLPLIFLGAAPSPQALMGNLLIIFASIAWVAGAIISKKMLSKYSTLTITTIIFLVGVATFLLPAVSEYLQNPSWPGRVTIMGLGGLVYISLLSSVCAYFLFEWSLGKLGVVKADLFQYLEPGVTVTLGVLLLNESLRFSFVVGAILIGLGVYWGTLGREHHKHHKAHRN